MFKQTEKSRQVFDHLGYQMDLAPEVFMLLLESSTEIAHKIYVDNMRCLGRDIGKLRSWLWESQKESREFGKIVSKKEVELKRIINQLHDTIQHTKEVKNKLGAKLIWGKIRSIKEEKGKICNHWNSNFGGRSGGDKQRKSTSFIFLWYTSVLEWAKCDSGIVYDRKGLSNINQKTT